VSFRCASAELCIDLVLEYYKGKAIAEVKVLEKAGEGRVEGMMKGESQLAQD
jgi:hypothetical protein